MLHNPTFKGVEFDTFLHEAGAYAERGKKTNYLINSPANRRIPKTHSLVCEYP